MLYIVEEAVGVQHMVCQSQSPGLKLQVHFSRLPLMEGDPWIHLKFSGFNIFYFFFAFCLTTYFYLHFRKKFLSCNAAPPVTMFVRVAL